MNIAEYFNKFIRTRTVAYYIALGVSLLSVFVGIIAAVVLSEYGTTWPVVLLTIAGFVVFVVLSFLGQDGMGAGAMAAFTFAALLALIVGEYSYFLTEVQGQAMGAGFDLGAVEGLYLFIVAAVWLLVCAIALNVFAWLRLKKKITVEKGAFGEGV